VEFLFPSNTGNPFEYEKMHTFALLLNITKIPIVKGASEKNLIQKTIFWLSLPKK